MKYDTNKNGIEFGEFLACMAYVMICKKLMGKYDPQNKGQITIDYNGLTALGLWFMWQLLITIKYKISKNLL